MNTVDTNNILNLRNLICNAIKSKQRIQFMYNDKLRIGEPQCCGISTAEKEVARLHLLQGGSRPEQLFELAKVSSLILLNEHFTKPGPYYSKDVKAMKEIFCQL